MSQLGTVNEFVLRFANVNGSGSASANGMIAKALFRMGLPVGPKNIFPSNIQGLPTWFEIRVSEAGYTGRRGGVDLMIAMNAQTLREDVAAIEPGGYLLYDATKPLARELLRDDIQYLALPLTAIAVEHFSNPRQRLLFKNIMYAGALSAFIDIELEVLEALIHEQFAGKKKLIEPNLKALDLGRRFAFDNFECPLPIRAERRDAVGDRILIDGNGAAALGCVYAGATVAAWYPITPSTSLVDAFGSFCERLRRETGEDGAKGARNYAIIQAEDELSAMGVVVGASWNGARAFTATSGPGVSLMQEFLGLCYYAEIPAVLFDIQRVGPSTGMPTRTQQSDLMAAAYASHGDTRHVLLLPSTPNECFEMGALAFDLAERIQTPVLVLSDLDLGMNDWVTEPFAWDDAREPDRGKVLDFEDLDSGAEFFRYLDVDGDAIPYRTYPGTHPSRGAFFTRGSGHDRFGGYTEDGARYQDNLDRLNRKSATAATLVPAPERVLDQGAPVGLLYFGTTAEPMQETLDLLAAARIRVDAMRLRAFPFSDEVFEYIEQHDRVIVIEQNRDAQMRSMLMIEGDVDPARLLSVRHYAGMPVTARFLVDEITKHAQADTVPLQREA